MEITKIMVEQDQYVISADGTFRRYVNGLSEEDKKSAIAEVRNYEDSAKGVIFARLLERGVLTELKHVRKEEKTEEENAYNMALTLLDGVMDDNYERSDYYLFTPATEQDIKDLATYAKMRYDANLIHTTPDDDGWRGTGHPEVGKTYVFQLNSEAEWCYLISPASFVKRVEKMSGILEALGKKQLKAVKK